MGMFAEKDIIKYQKSELDRREDIIDKQAAEIERLQETQKTQHERIKSKNKKIDELEQERDLLKAKVNSLHSALLLVTEELESWKATEDCPESIMAIHVGKAAARSTPPESLAAHDAEAIERLVDDLDFVYSESCGHALSVDEILEYANQLRASAGSDES